MSGEKSPFGKPVSQPQLRINTAAEFEQRRLELPEGGRFHELHEGQLKLLSTPEDMHGTVVFNISRALAQFLQQSSSHTTYACFGLGLHVSTNPDTVYAPAISLFQSGSPFSQNDLNVASEVPALVVDVASTNDRRTDMRRRTAAYLSHGVECVWVPDPFKKEIQIISREKDTLALGSWQTLNDESVLPGFSVAVEQVFSQPDWWDGQLPECGSPD
ncbi:MAG: Uma2 family endonuclease [Planctomycetaceae bacterium]|jgi:Uma2 family endonuclease